MVRIDGERVTRRAEQLRETRALSWELACRHAELEREQLESLLALEDAGAELSCIGRRNVLELSIAFGLEVS